MAQSDKKGLSSMAPPLTQSCPPCGAEMRVARRELVAMQPDAGGAEVVDLDKRAAEIVARRRAR